MLIYRGARYRLAAVFLWSGISKLLDPVSFGILIDRGCFGPQDPEARAFHGLRTALYKDFMMMSGVLYLYIWRYYRSVRPDRFRNYFNRFNTKGEF